jgi:hypothetical protein
MTRLHADLLLRASTANVRVLFFGNGALYDLEVLQAVLHDVQLAVGCFLVTMIFLWVHTGSGLLAAAAMGSIALSFPVAFFIYSRAVGESRLEVLNFLSLYIVIGIGADNVFLMCDTFEAQAGQARAEARARARARSALQDARRAAAIARSAGGRGGRGGVASAVVSVFESESEVGFFTRALAPPSLRTH